MEPLVGTVVVKVVETMMACACVCKILMSAHALSTTVTRTPAAIMLTVHSTVLVIAAIMAEELTAKVCRTATATALNNNNDDDDDDECIFIA